MIAVSVYHSHGAVHVLSLPCGVVRDAVSALICPTLVTFHVCLVHHVQTIVVKHCVHLGLSWIVACSHRIDVALFHQFDIFQHSGYVDRTAIQRMTVLCIYAFEVDALAIDFYDTSCDFHFSETVFSRKYHFFFACSILLCHHHGVQIGLFARPHLQLRQIVESHVDILTFFPSTEGYFCRICSYHSAIGSKQFCFDLFLWCAIFTFA